MKRTLQVALCGLLAVLALALAGPVGADVTVQTTEPWSEAAANTCATPIAEEVFLEGTVHSVVRLGLSPDGRTHYGVSSAWSALKGTTPTGARYVETRIENNPANFDSDFAPAEFTTDSLQILTRLGEDGTFVEGDDLRVHISAHLTLNANGTITADHTDSRVECN